MTASLYQCGSSWTLVSSGLIGGGLLVVSSVVVPAGPDGGPGCDPLRCVSGGPAGWVATEDGRSVERVEVAPFEVGAADVEDVRRGDVGIELEVVLRPVPVEGPA